MAVILCEPNNPYVTSARSAVARAALTRSNAVEIISETLSKDPKWRKIDNTPNNPNWRTL